MAARRRAYWLPAALLLVVMFPGVASAQVSGPGPFCAPAGSATENCIVQNSLTVDGLAAPSNITASLEVGGAGRYMLFFTNTANTTNPVELASTSPPGLTTANVVSIRFKLSASAVDPKISASTGLISSWTLDATPNPNEITFVARPRATSWAQTCDPSSCPNNATTDYQALLLAGFDPMQPPPSPPAGFTDFSQKFTGGFVATNAQYFDPIPSYDATTKALSLFIGAPSFKKTGSPNTGFVRLFVPEAVITDLWQVSGGSVALAANNSLTTVTVGGSAASFTIEAVTGGGALFKIGEATPFSYSVPQVVVKPAAAAASGPTVTAISPASGNTTGGTHVSITGTGFAAGATVTIGGTAATNVTFVSAMSLTARTPAGTAGAKNVVVTVSGTSATLTNGFTYVDIAAAPTADNDSDGMTDLFEARYGLDILANDASADRDGDGKTNLREFQDGTHPNGLGTRYLAEGATGTFFDLSFALVNPNTEPAAVLLRFLKTDGSTASHFLSVPARTRSTVDAESVSGLSAAEFSTVVESDVGVVVDRTMTWNTSGYGSHAETAIAAPATTWYLAEGATHSGFDLYYLIQNPNAGAATVTVKYLLPAPAAPITKTYTVAANSRFNIWVDGDDTRLASTDVSAQITANVAIIVERAMYLNSGGLTFGAGHESAGVTGTATNWFLAEGATGSYFDLFILIANPNSQAAAVTATYLLTNGTTVTKNYTVAANSRQNIWVDKEDPLLADAAVSTTITSTNGVGIIVERAMWWPGPTAATWQEAHNSPGSTVTGTRWALAEGELGGTRSIETYILIANTGSATGSVQVTLLFEDGTTSAKTFSVPGNSRFNVNVAAEFATASGKKFGAIVESQGASPAPIVVERAMYSNASGVVWAAGTNSLATKLQ